MTSPSLHPCAQLDVVEVLGIAVDSVNMQRALDRIAQHLDAGEKGYICVAGVHGIMEAQRCPELCTVYGHSLMTVPDGMPLVWVGQMQGHATMERVTGPDLMLQIFAELRFAGLTHFFYGGEPGVAEELRSRLQQQFPHAHIVGTYTPPFRELNLAEETEFLAAIQELQPDVIWVGIGCPRQEIFMAHYLDRLKTRLIFGVGAAFDYHTGRIRDSAPWIKQAGLQWLHRLLQDPRRLWKRYLRNNPPFVWRIALQMLGWRATAHNCSNMRVQSMEDRGSSHNKATQY
jgi:N-acetylglucosaminyldiphosphoundecaprenol N-acetyl-beta-D-mannosaminyltransferase